MSDRIRFAPIGGTVDLEIWDGERHAGWIFLYCGPHGHKVCLFEPDDERHSIARFVPTDSGLQSAKAWAVGKLTGGEHG